MTYTREFTIADVKADDKVQVWSWLNGTTFPTVVFGVTKTGIVVESYADRSYNAKTGRCEEVYKMIDGVWKNGKNILEIRKGGN